MHIVNTYLSKEEIKAIDDRITSCLIEVPSTEYDDNEYYVKIWFKFKLDEKLHKDGRTEFISDSKEDLINQIKNFFTENHGWVIV